MKKGLLLLVMMILLSGCIDNKLNKEKQIYNNFISKLNNVSDEYFNDNIPFDINVYLDKIIDSELIYRVIIDNPKESIRNITAIAIHNFKTNDIYPTSGIFDSKLNLIPNEIDIDKNNAKGIILIGYISYDGKLDDFNGTIKVLVNYIDKNNNEHDIYYVYHK